jgi:hypothetical protein
VRNEEIYPSRLKKFSDAFFHKVTKGEPYPLDPKEQGRSYLFPDTRIQFLTLNSAWQIDQFHRTRSAVHFDAVTGVVAQAERQIAQAVQRGDLEKNRPVLRFAVWHHAVAGPEMMQSIDFIGNLQMAGVKVCLHGDVHEMRCELIGYKTGKEMQIVGAGSFGSPAKGRPESTPRLYNILEIEPDFSSIRVHTRERRKAEGAWGAWYEWPNPDGRAGRVPYFDIRLT